MSRCRTTGLKGDYGMREQDNNLLRGGTDQAMSLHYIDKCYQGLTEIWAMINGTLIWQSISCIVLIGLATGTVSNKGPLTLGGIDLVMAPAILIIGLSWFVGLMLMFCFSLKCREIQLRTSIIEQYSNLGCPPTWRYEYIEARSIDKIIINAVSTDSYWLTKAVSFSSMLLVNITFSFLPLLAIGFSVYRVASTYGWTWWIICLYVLLIAMILCYVLSVFVKVSESERMRRA